MEVTGVLTNTDRTSPYRAAGRPEAAYVIERLVNQAARSIVMDRAEIRRRNTIPPDAFPSMVGSVPAVASAVLDALGPLGVTTIDLPATPEAVWRAIEAAGDLPARRRGPLS